MSRGPHVRVRRGWDGRNTTGSCKGVGITLGTSTASTWYLRMLAGKESVTFQRIQEDSFSEHPACSRHIYENIFEQKCISLTKHSVARPCLHNTLGKCTSGNSLAVLRNACQLFTTAMLHKCWRQTLRDKLSEQGAIRYHVPFRGFGL